MVDQNLISLFNAIYDATNRKILGFITAKCGNTSDISDIFQDTYTKPQIVQKIFLLRYSLDMTIPEIAKLLSVGESYVKNILYRTINQLRELYVRKDGIDL